MGLFNIFSSKNKAKYKITSAEENGLVVVKQNNNQVKINSKINVPEGFCAVTFCKEKFLDVILAGTHEINIYTVPLAFKKNKMQQQKNGKAKKEMKLDFYFVNLSVFKIKANLNKKKKKHEVFFEIVLKIVDAISFLKYVSSEKIKFSSSFVENLLKVDICSEINSLNVVEEDILLKHLENKLENIGVEILDLTIFATKDLEEKIAKEHENRKTIEAPNNIKTEIKHFNKSSVVDLSEITADKIIYFVCDNCGSKLPQNSNMCYKCGKSFVEQNCCEACGRVIDKDTYVCPYCNSIVIQNKD